MQSNNPFRDIQPTGVQEPQNKDIKAVQRALQEHVQDGDSSDEDENLALKYNLDTTKLKNSNLGNTHHSDNKENGDDDNYDDSDSEDGNYNDNDTPRYKESELRALFGPGASAARVEFDLKVKDKQRRADPLDPEPPQFSKPLRLINEAESFDPLVMYALHEQMSKGFPPCFPEALKSHSIDDQDWKRFIEDICMVQSQLGPQKMWVYVGMLGRDAGASSRALKRRLGRKSTRKAQELAKVWNEKFFNPRKVHITIQSPEDLRKRDDAPDTVKKAPNYFKQTKIRQIHEEKCRLLIFSL